MGAPNCGFEYRERVGAAVAGAAAEAYLAARHPHSSLAEWAARLARGEVDVDGKPARPGQPVGAGQALAWRRPGWVEPEAPLEFGVLYDDGDLFAVDKPAGLPTLPGGNFLEHSLLWQVRRKAPGAAPAHRLDRGTSGVVLFARSARARARVAEAWRQGRVEKRYLARVVGEPSRNEFAVDSPIGLVRRLGAPPVYAVSGDGKPAQSRVRVLSRGSGQALVELVLTTGRPHQARVHLARAGYPLVGDPLYGKGGTPSPTARAGDGGFFLRASRLALPHPATESRLVIDAP